MAVGTISDLLAHADRLGPLVADARHGDHGALEELVSASYDHVFRVCRRVIGNDADAADATRDALASMVRALRRLDDRTRYTTWLYRSAVGAATDHARRRRSRRRAPGSNDIGLIASESDLDSMVESIDVDFGLMELPLDSRVAVVLRDLCGLDYPHIGEILEVSADSVRTRVARGRGRLVDLLSPTSRLG